MAQHSAVGVYGTLDDAASAVRSLGTELPFALLGGAEPGMVGPMTGVVGWLYQLGMAREAVEGCEQAIKAGKFVIVVHGSEEAAARGREGLAASRAEKVELHVLPS
jgi:hypothetical protein